MTAKEDFTSEEWATLVEGPLHAGLRVITAGRGGTIRESLAVGKTYAEARREHGDSDLLDAVVSAAPSLDPARLRSAGDISGVSAARLAEAITILTEKASPEEIDTYKRFVLTVARVAAHAHREGGRTGTGGEQVSESEQEALDQISTTLEIEP